MGHEWWEGRTGVREGGRQRRIKKATLAFALTTPCGAPAHVSPWGG